jgi:hypothetical protein
MRTNGISVSHVSWKKSWIERPDLRVQYSRVARQRIDSFFNSENTIRRTRELYREPMAEKGKPDP